MFASIVKHLRRQYGRDLTKNMNERQIKEMMSFLSDVGNYHVYSVAKYAERYSEWHVIRAELISQGCYNESEGMFAIDASMPVDVLRKRYEDMLNELNRRLTERKQERFHRYWQDAWIALSVLLSATALILSLIK